MRGGPSQAGTGEVGHPRRVRGRWVISGWYGGAGVFLCGCGGAGVFPCVCVCAGGGDGAVSLSSLVSRDLCKLRAGVNTSSPVV